MAIGLPTIDIIFKKLAATLVTRSASGIVALIVKDDTDSTHAVKEYTSVLQIDATKFTMSNVQYIKDVFLGGAAKVIVAPVATDSVAVIGDAIKTIGSRKYNWIGLAEGKDDEQTDLVAYIKEQETAKKSVKAVVFDATAPDCQHIVNFTNPSVTTASGKLTGEKYVSRLLGLLAGMPLTRSSTYYGLADLISVEEPADVESAVNAGEFVLFNDDDLVRVARGVNSLTTLSSTVSEEFKKIVIVETMDMIRADISATFKNDYLGKFKNKYDYQVLLITAINSYFDALANEDILDNTFANRAYIDIEAQRAAWIATGKAEAEGWDEQTVKNNTFRSNVYLGGNIKITDAMEDFEFGIDLQ
ncbi:phage tail sheath C-terminal domain-containing protein [Paenibacillus chibensis]|uniref:Phage tail sheath C-terminal domain-containing protein n=1 Tax=Paenibacillus chibensis TaxID=59846 RepID=A0ABU6PV84_9BACL|nr:phage tail sheath C-terminal domain-containing protein [Paenibacillus chibensis]